MICHIDHITHAIDFKNEEKEIKKWNSLGFKEHVRLNTKIYSATHIALVKGLKSGYTDFIDRFFNLEIGLFSKQKPIAWDIMTGLSISEDPNSPINKFVNLYGEGVQHVAYNVDLNTDMNELYKKLKETHDLLTPVLNYKDASGAGLKQIFTRPKKPWGSFEEYAQRIPGPNGNPFDGFDVDNIENLYKEYDDYSKYLNSENKINVNFGNK